MKEAFCSSFEVAIETCTANTLVLISESDWWDILAGCKDFVQIFSVTSRLARRTAIMGNGTACMFLAHSSQLWGRRRRWHHNFISGPLRFFVAPQFHQLTITVSVHGYLFQEVRDWISNWREIVFVRKRLFFSILSSK